MAAKSDIEWTDASYTPIRARNKTTGKSVLRSANDPIRALSAVDLAYMAGLIDGEGSLSCIVHGGGKTCYPTISVAMTDFPVIHWLADKWHVTVSNFPRRDPRYKPQVFVRLSGERARLLCELLLPYLIVKKRQAELIQTFPLEARLGRGVRIADTGINEMRFALRDQINGLNHVPRNPTYRRGVGA
jgi:hypothetical protein